MVMRFSAIVIGGLLALGLSACGSGESAGTTGAAPAGAQTIAVSATEFSFDPGTIQIDAPGTYTFDLTNDGGTGHALEVEGQGLEEETETVAPGSSAQLTVTFSKTGTYEFYCPVDGHRGRGMEGTLTVGAAGGTTGTGMTDTGGETDETETGDDSGGYG
jgi:VCBS repeat-containing protein